VTKTLVRDMRAFVANAIKQDEIPARQIHAFRQYRGSRERPIKLH
jgi:hypothetical protein